MERTITGKFLTAIHTAEPARTTARGNAPEAPHDNVAAHDLPTTEPFSRIQRRLAQALLETDAALGTWKEVEDHLASQEASRLAAICFELHLKTPHKVEARRTAIISALQSELADTPPR